MSKVLVLGGTGLLGFATTEELVRRGHQVVSVSLPPMPADDLFDHLGDAVENHLVDIADLSDDEVLQLMDGVRAVMFAIGADERVTPPAPASRFFYVHNVLPTQRMARLAREAGVEAFVVYGSMFADTAEDLPELGFREQAYPMTRLLQEQVAFCEGDGAMRVMSLRLPYIFGVMPGRTPLWAMFADQIRGQQAFYAHEGGKTPAVTTRQVAEAACGAMERGEHRKTYSLSELNLSHADFYAQIAKKLGQETQIALVPFEALKPAFEQIDRQSAEAGVEHGIHMVDAGYARSLDLSKDPAIMKDQLGVTDDDVVAAIDEVMDRVIADHEAQPVEPSAVDETERADDVPRTDGDALAAGDRDGGRDLVDDPNEPPSPHIDGVTS